MQLLYWQTPLDGQINGTIQCRDGCVHLRSISAAAQQDHETFIREFTDKLERCPPSIGDVIDELSRAGALPVEFNPNIPGYGPLPVNWRDVLANGAEPDHGDGAIDEDAGDEEPLAVPPAEPTSPATTEPVQPATPVPDDAPTDTAPPAEPVPAVQPAPDDLAGKSLKQLGVIALAEGLKAEEIEGLAIDDLAALIHANRISEATAAPDPAAQAEGA